jgi:DNA-binding response OmpR family regulator
MANKSADQTVRLIKRDLYLNGSQEPIRLRPTEARLLEVLLRNANQVVSRATLMREVWHTDFLEDTRTLDVHISWLRGKIEQDPSFPQRIITVRGVGYSFLLNNEGIERESKK